MAMESVHVNDGAYHLNDASRSEYPVFATTEFAATSEDQPSSQLLQAEYNEAEPLQTQATFENRDTQKVIERDTPTRKRFQSDELVI